MKPRHPFFAILFATGLAALVLPGCSSFMNRHSGPDATRPVGGKSLRIIQLRDKVKATRLSLNRTIDTLNRLPGSPATDQAYQAFSTDLKDFNKTADDMLETAEDVRSRGRELFAEWSAETESIQDPDIRAVAEQRRKNLGESYNTMLPPLLTARNDLELVRSNLNDMQKALALDLTPAGIEATRDPIDKINRQSQVSVKSLDALSAQLDRIAEELPAPAVKASR